MVLNRRTRKSNRMRGYDYRIDGYYFVTICVQHREGVFGEIIDEKMKLNNYGNIVESCWYDLPHHYQNCILDEFIIMPNHVHGIIRIDNHVGNGLKPFPNEGNNADEFLKQNFELHTRDGNGLKPFPTKSIQTESFPNDGNVQNISLIQFPDVKNNTQLFSKQGTQLHTRDGNGLKPFPTDVKIHSLSEMVRAFKTFSSRRINEIANFRFQWQKSFYDHIVRNEKTLEYIRNYIRNNPSTWTQDSINPKNLSS
ncbi:MAG: transposase [Candidatus Magasanikbacteria bacterium]|nr:transposase [Candidatus Magasanikbacteria bacterium]